MKMIFEACSMGDWRYLYDVTFKVLPLCLILVYFFVAGTVVAFSVENVPVPMNFVSGMYTCSLVFLVFFLAGLLVCYLNRDRIRRSDCPACTRRHAEKRWKRRQVVSMDDIGGDGDHHHRPARDEEEARAGLAHPHQPYAELPPQVPPSRYAGQQQQRQQRHQQEYVHPSIPTVAYHPPSRQATTTTTHQPVPVPGASSSRLSIPVTYEGLLSARGTPEPAVADSPGPRDVGPARQPAAHSLDGDDDGSRFALELLDTTFITAATADTDGDDPVDAGGPISPTGATDGGSSPRGTGSSISSLTMVGEDEEDDNVLAERRADGKDHHHEYNHAVQLARQLFSKFRIMGIRDAGSDGAVIDVEANDGTVA